MILVDENTLVRLTNRKDPGHKTTQPAVFKLRATDVLALTPQCLYEFRAVATRSPAHNGIRWTRCADSGGCKGSGECSKCLPIRSNCSMCGRNW